MPPPQWLEKWRTEEPLFIDEAAVVAALSAAEHAAAPADPLFVAAELERTLELYGVPANWDAIADFYLEAFEDVPPDLVQLACKRLRRSPLRFFPKPGEIRSHIAEDLAERNATLRKARLALTRQRDPEPEQPPLTEADKAAVADLMASAKAILAASAATLAMPKERGDASRPMTAADSKRVADECASYRLVDDDDPRLAARLLDMGVDP